MTQNIFETIQLRKQALAAITEKAVKFNWIDGGQGKGILDKLDADVLTIGVIGQMKSGKSTFLNSFVFEDNKLPVATIPMTAALSVITYGEEEKIIAKFYTKDEWDEQKLQAARSLESVAGNSMEESKVKAAKELIERAWKLGAKLETYLEKGEQEDQIENLEEYVGAEGKYISITKSVDIYSSKQYLKGVNVVDTPGFNDPIVSREKQTKDFLKKADVVLLMLYAGRPFDVTDRDILFENVRQCGIGKVIVGINKYDIPYGNGETPDEIKSYVKQEIQKACKAYSDDTLVDILKEVEPIPLSAEMALLSQMPKSKIAQNDSFKHAWERLCDVFEISSQEQMKEKSHFNDLTSAIKTLVETEKNKILFIKPLNVILANGSNHKDVIYKDIREYENLIKNLNVPDRELEERLDNLKKAERRLEKKIEMLGDDIGSDFRNIVCKGKKKLEDLVDKSCCNMQRTVDDWTKFEDDYKVNSRLNTEEIKLTKMLKRDVENLSEEAARKVKDCTTNFFCDAEQTLRKYLPEDFYEIYFIKSITQKVNFEIEKEDLFSSGISEENNDGGNKNIFIFINSALKNWFNHSGEAKKKYDYINFRNNDFDPKPYLENIYGRKDEIIEMVKRAFIDELIQPMKEQIKEIQSKTIDKENRLKDALEKLEELKLQKDIIDRQIEEIHIMSYQLKIKA